MLNKFSWPIGLIAGVVLLKLIRHFFRRSYFARLAHQNADKKRLARDQRRDQLLNLLRTKYAQHMPDASIVQKISESTAVELLDGLEKKHFTYAQITLVLSLRSIKIGQETNATTEEFFDEAMEQAVALDANADTDENGVLLKGIPISIKEHINQKGADSSMGMSMRNFKPSTKDSLVIQLLKQQGALAGFVRTATIQGMMLPDTESATYGVGRNPFDYDRTTGGSSGGEGALIAARGAPIGIGTDIGGSIRIPAHFCGVFGYKPTPGRVTTQGLTSPSRRTYIGETNIRSTVGPLGRCTDDLVLVMRSFLQDNMWLNDPQLCRQPWREERFQDKKRLTIGFFTSDNWFPPAPACVRAVNEAAEMLRQLGHNVVPYTPINVPEAVRLFTSIIGADANLHFIESLENEPINPLYLPLVYASKVPNFLRPTLAFLMRLVGERRNSHILKSGGSKTAYQYFDMIIDLKFYINKWLDDLKEKKIDLLLVSYTKQKKI